MRSKCRRQRSEAFKLRGTPKHLQQRCDANAVAVYIERYMGPPDKALWREFCAAAG